MKEKRFFLSIIVIGYNTSGALTKCLHSLNLQKLDGFDAEIIYVDDGSIDDSVKIFNNFPLNYHKELVVHNNNPVGLVDHVFLYEIYLKQLDLYPLLHFGNF